jgi:hypothetical protein
LQRTQGWGTLSRGGVQGRKAGHPPGTGTVVGISPSKILFGGQQVGTTSAPMTVVLANDANAPLSISHISLVGFNATDFSETNNCGATLGSRLGQRDLYAIQERNQERNHQSLRQWRRQPPTDHSRRRRDVVYETTYHDVRPCPPPNEVTMIWPLLEIPLFHSPIVTSDLAPNFKSGDHGRGSDGPPSAKPIPLSCLLSRFWYLSSLKTRFCEVHFRETRAGQGFQPDQ